MQKVCAIYLNEPVLSLTVASETLWNMHMLGYKNTALLDHICTSLMKYKETLSGPAIT